jgi:drug/metabolite transporter (DMT)-like permease
MVGSSLSFATMAALSRALAISADWRLLALARTGLMLIFAGAIALTLRTRLTLRGSPTLWMRSLIGSLGMLGTFYALTHLPISDAVTILHSYPIWVSILSWVALRSRPGPKVWIAGAMGLFGVALIAQPHFAEARLALLVALGSSLCTALVMLNLNRLGHLDSHAVVVHFSVTSTAICAAVFLISGTEIPRSVVADPQGVAMLLGVGLSGTIGQIALTRAFALGDAPRVSMVALTQILFALAYERLFWPKPYSLLTLAGMILVAAPTAWLLLIRPLDGPGRTLP